MVWASDECTISDTWIGTRFEIKNIIQIKWLSYLIPVTQCELGHLENQPLRTNPLHDALLSLFLPFSGRELRVKPTARKLYLLVDGPASLLSPRRSLFSKCSSLVKKHARMLQFSRYASTIFRDAVHRSINFEENLCFPWQKHKNIELQKKKKNKK